MGFCSWGRTQVALALAQQTNPTTVIGGTDQKRCQTRGCHYGDSDPEILVLRRHRYDDVGN